jgi:hypothetical protein
VRQCGGLTYGRSGPRRPAFHERKPRLLLFSTNKPRYHIGFAAKSIVHYRAFSVGGAKPGRESEANSLYNNAAYLTEIRNALAETVRSLSAIESRVPVAPLE